MDIHDDIDVGVTVDVAGDDVGVTTTVVDGAEEDGEMVTTDDTVDRLAEGEAVTVVVCAAARPARPRRRKGRILEEVRVFGKLERRERGAL